MEHLKYRGYRTPPPSPSPPPCPFLSRFSLCKILFFPLYFDFVQYAKRMGIRLVKLGFIFQYKNQPNILQQKKTIVHPCLVAQCIEWWLQRRLTSAKKTTIWIFSYAWTIGTFISVMRKRQGSFGKSQKWIKDEDMNFWCEITGCHVPFLGSLSLSIKCKRVHAVEG